MYEVGAFNDSTGEHEGQVSWEVGPRDGLAAADVKVSKDQETILRELADREPSRVADAPRPRARTDGSTTLVVTCRRGDASIATTLTDGKLDLSRMPLHTRTADARPAKLRNISAALAVMAAPAG